jgi:hypothetical protein
MGGGTYIDPLRVVDDAVLYHLLQFFLGDAEGGLNLVERVHEVRPTNLDVLDIFESW